MLNCLRIFIVVSCGKIPIAIGQIFWRTAHPFSSFLVIFFSYFWFVFWLVAFGLRYYRLISSMSAAWRLQIFNRILPRKYRGVGVGCDAPHLFDPFV